MCELSRCPKREVVEGVKSGGEVLYGKGLRTATGRKQKGSNTVWCSFLSGLLLMK